MRKILVFVIMLVMSFSAVAFADSNEDSSRRFREKQEQLRNHPKHNPTKDPDVEKGYRKHQKDYENKNPKQPENYGGIKG